MKISRAGTARRLRQLLPTLVLVALSGCGDAKSRPESKNMDTKAGAAEVVKLYYGAIAGGHYDSAYALWEGSGKASGQTLAKFEYGFAQTRGSTAAIGDSVHVEGAAGSQYATVPVTVESLLRDGTRQHFVGTYTLRRAVVDGATPEQRTWHIYSAHLIQH